MHKITFKYLLVFIVSFLISCSGRQYQSLFQQKNTLADSSVNSSGVLPLGEYHIRSQDILQVRNLQDIKYIANDALVSANTSSGNATTGQTFQVEEDGNVTLPVIGHVQVVGLTRMQAQEKIELLYRKDVLVNPIIEVKIVNLKVTIFGEAKTNGNIPLVKDKTTLTDVLGQAGGLTERADEKHIRIIRGTEAKPQVIIVDLGNISSINDPKSVLQNGDIIYVALNKRAIRNEGYQNISAISQPALLFISTALLIITLIRR